MIDNYLEAVVYVANVFFTLVYTRCLAGTIPEYGTR